MGILRVNSSFNFEKKIKSFCQPPRYEIGELEEDFAMVKIYDAEPDSDYRHFITINLIGDIVQFGIPSPMLFKADEAIPDSLSTILLKINSYSFSGFWCLDKLEDGRHVFVYLYNTPKMSLNKKQFDNIIDELLEGYDVLEGILMGDDTDMDDDMDMDDDDMDVDDDDMDMDDDDMDMDDDDPPDDFVEPKQGNAT